MLVTLGRRSRWKKAVECIRLFAYGIPSTLNVCFCVWFGSNRWMDKEVVVHIYSEILHVCVCVCVCACSVPQSRPTRCDPMDCSPPGSSVHGILQARILEWVAMPFSSGPSRPWESNLGLLHWQEDSLPLRHLGIVKKKKKKKKLKLFNACRRVWLVCTKSPVHSFLFLVQQ